MRYSDDGQEKMQRKRKNGKMVGMDDELVD